MLGTSCWALRVRHFVFVTPCFALRVRNFVLGTSCLLLRASHFVFVTPCWALCVGNFVLLCRFEQCVGGGGGERVVEREKKDKMKAGRQIDL